MEVREKRNFWAQKVKKELISRLKGLNLQKMEHYCLEWFVLENVLQKAPLYTITMSFIGYLFNVGNFQNKKQENTQGQQNKQPRKLQICKR